MKKENSEFEQRSIWKKAKEGFSSFFFEPLPTEDTEVLTNSEPVKRASSYFDPIPAAGGTNMTKNTYSEAAKKPAPTQTSVNDVREFSRKKSVPASQPVIPESEKAYITKDTIIEGNIATSSDIHVLGVVNGNVTSEGIIVLSGKIVGDVQANSLTIDSGTVSGDITCTAGVVLSNQAIVNGSIDAQSVDCNGEIRGDVKTSKTVVLRQSALVCGDIITKTINMQDGAILQGNIKMPVDKTSAQIHFKEDSAI